MCHIMSTIDASICLSSSVPCVPYNELYPCRQLSSSVTPDYGGGGGVAKTVSMFSKLLNQGSAFVVEGVKNFVLKENVRFLPMLFNEFGQGVLQLQAWVSANGVLKDCMIKVYLRYRILMK